MTSLRHFLKRLNLIKVQFQLLYEYWQTRLYMLAFGHVQYWYGKDIQIQI